jgi:DNA polymerase
MTTNDPRAELASIAASLRVYLEWQQESGALGIPRSAGRSEAQAAPPASSVASPASAAAPPSGAPSFPSGGARSDAAPSPPGAVSLPSAAAAAAPSPASAGAATGVVRLPQLAAEVASCMRCALAASRTQTVFSRGNPEARLCFVGEAPGADEDAQGLPFVGRAGQLLDRMIGAMGLSPERDVYVCNILKCRPPGNRRPEPEEIATCIPYLHEQLAIVKPRVIVAMGNTAVAALLDTKLGITKVRGQWKLYRGQTLVMPTYHPSYLLRPSPQQIEAKRQAWQDLQLVMKELGLNAKP